VTDQVYSIVNDHELLQSLLKGVYCLRGLYDVSVNGTPFSLPRGSLCSSVLVPSAKTTPRAHWNSFDAIDDVKSDLLSTSTSIVHEYLWITNYYIFTDITLFFTRPLKMMPNPAWISALEGQLMENPKSVSK
jgi:hypothetical protein